MVQKKADTIGVSRSRHDKSSARLVIGVLGNEPAACDVPLTHSCLIIVNIQGSFTWRPLLKLFKLLTEKEIINPYDFVNINLNLRCHSKNIGKQQCMKLCRRRVFSQRVVVVWNSLPNNIISASSKKKYN